MSESSTSGSHSQYPGMDNRPSKLDIERRTSKMDANAVDDIVNVFGIPRDLNPRPPPLGMTMDRLPPDVIGLYSEYFYEGGLSVPFSTFLLDVIRHFKVHISQLVPLGMHRATLFEVYCRCMRIKPTTPLFRVFYKLCKQGSWFSFEKRVGRDRKVCFGDFPSSLKGWKSEFFLIDRRAIPFAMPWRHHDSDVSDPFPRRTEYNMTHAEALAETVVEPLQLPHGFLYALGLSYHWAHPGYRAVLRDEEGRGTVFVFVFYLFAITFCLFLRFFLFVYNC